MKTDPIQAQNPSAVKRPTLIERLMAFENQFANEESDLLWEAIDAIATMSGEICIQVHRANQAEAVEREECAKVAISQFVEAQHEL